MAQWVMVRHGTKTKMREESKCEGEMRFEFQIVVVDTCVGIAVGKS